eukprot:scaffold510043_cov59-Attheya_sp.AAC.1
MSSGPPVRRHQARARLKQGTVTVCRHCAHSNGTAAAAADRHSGGAFSHPGPPLGKKEKKHHSIPTCPLLGEELIQ